MCCCIVTGCSLLPKSSSTGLHETLGSAVTSGPQCSSMLSWVGGVCILAGMAMLVITRGKMGWYPLVGGILFVVINFAIALYASWFFIPVAVCTGAISLAWAGKVVWKIVNDDKIKLKELKL
jgi:hypothetical protein